MKVDYQPYNNDLPSGEINTRATPDDFGSGYAQAEQGVANTLNQTGDMLSQHAIQFQQIQNETEVNDVYTNQFSPAFRDKRMAFYNLQGKDATTQMPDYMDSFEKMRQETRDSLQNPAQQRMFDDMSRKRVEMELDQMSVHAATENKKWQNSTSESVIENNKNDAVDHRNDPKFIQTMVNSIPFEVNALYGKYGEATVKAETDKHLSDLYSRIARAKADDGDIQGAQDFLKKLPTPQQSVAAQQIQPAIDSQSAVNTRDNIMNGAPGSNYGQLKDAQAQIESSGDVNAIGPLVTHPDGTVEHAYGKYQILPSTAQLVAKELGLPFDMQKLKTDEGYQEALRNRLMDDNMKRYGGNQTLALLAYHGGPGEADKMQAKFGTPGGDIPEDEWCEKVAKFAPKGADYVKKINTICPPKPGVDVQSPDISNHMDELLDMSRSMVSGFSRSDPNYAKLVNTTVGNHIDQIQQTQQKAAVDSRNNVVSAVNQAAIAGNPPSTIKDLPAEAQQHYGTMKADDQQKTLEYIERVGNRTAALTNENIGQQQYLRRMAVEDPEKFVNLDFRDPEVNKNLRPRDIEEFLKMQGSVSKGQAADATKQIVYKEGVSAVTDMVAPLAKADAAILKNNPNTDPLTLRSEQFKDAFLQKISDYQTANGGKRPDTKAYRDMAADLLAQVSVERGHFHSNPTMYKFQTIGSNANQNIIGGKSVDQYPVSYVVPDYWAKQALQSYTDSHGGKKPDDPDHYVQWAWQRTKFGRSQ